MTTSRKKPGVAFWATVVVVMALVGYPLSFGPACWIASRQAKYEGRVPVPAIYRPILWAWFHSPRPIFLIIYRYASLGSTSNLIVGRMYDETLVVGEVLP
jgi:hypothetical protein